MRRSLPFSLSGRRAAAGLAAAVVAWCHFAAAAQPESPAEKAARARRAMEARRFDEAVALYGDLVRELPDNPGLRLNLGIALQSAGKYEPAAAELERVVAAQPDLTQAWFILGLVRLKLEQPARAIPALKTVVTREPANHLARLELADAHLETGAFDEAARLFAGLTATDPASPKAWLGLGRSYTGIARETFDRIDATAPHSAFRAALLGRSRAASQQYRSAFHLYRQALDADSHLRGAHTALAVIYRATGHPEWADEEERREAALGPPDCRREPRACAFAAGKYDALVAESKDAADPAALYWRSLAASELARSAFERLEQLPPSADLHALRAEAHGIRGLNDLAIKEWQLALEASPQDRVIQRKLAEAYWRNQDYAEARPRLQALLDAADRSPGLLYELGDTLLHLQDVETAIPILEKALRQAPDRMDVRMALARAYAAAGRWASAIPHLEAVQKADSDGAIHLLLARAYRATGHTEQSAAAAKRAQQLAAESSARQSDANNAGEITPP